MKNKKHIVHRVLIDLRKTHTSRKSNIQIRFVQEQATLSFKCKLRIFNT